MKKYAILWEDRFYNEFGASTRTFWTRIGVKRAIKKLIDISRRPWEYGGHDVRIRKIGKAYFIYVDDKIMYTYMYYTVND